MYDRTVTVFNFYESETTGNAYWYPHVLKNVDLNLDRGEIIKKYGPDSTDNAELHISYESDDEAICITDGQGKKLSWMPPKAWKSQTNDKLEESITFGPNDFFLWGEWTEGITEEDSYNDGFYHYLNSKKDYVFKITTVNGPYVVIPHFEITGK